MTKNKYQEYSKEKLIEKIKQLEKHRYGLVWEDKLEDVAEQCEKELPVLHEDTGKEFFSGENLPINILIEGDNYHALYTLNFTHKRKIDVIYIDPPYNTGNKSWRYNNDYIDKEDRFRHSKWLSFMSKRLRLARRLLKDTGIIVITIDDYEMSSLKLLMDDIFNEKNHLGTVVIKNNPSGRSTTSGFAIAHEYAMFYSKTPNAKVGRLQRTDDQIARYKEKDEIGFFEWVNFRARYTTASPRLQYPIFVKNDGSDFRIPMIKWNNNKQGYELLEQPKIDESINYPIDDSNQLRCWKWSVDTVHRQKELDMSVRQNQKKTPTIYVKARMKNEGMLPITLWDKTEYSATAYGTNLLAKLMNGEKKFDYPKSLYAVIDCLRVASEKKDALVLDFFAGSGTTGHAVLELNKEDGGKRNFVLCTNNENKICEEVTYQRIKKVMEGYNGKEGIPANLKYFKTEFVPQVITDNDKRVLVSRSTELLCLAENTFQLVKKSKRKLEYAIYKNNKKFTAIIYDEDAIEKCKEELNALNPTQKTVIYVFSYSETYYEEDFKDLQIQFEVKPIPEVILNVYRKNVKLKKK